MTVDVSGTEQFSDPYEWLLAVPDFQNPTARQYMRIHTLDIYFWVLNDTIAFYDVIQQALNKSQLEIPSSISQKLDEQRYQSRQQQEEQQRQQQQQPPINSIIQNLEHVALSDPAYSRNEGLGGVSPSISPALEHPLSPVSRQPAPVGALESQGVPKENTPNQAADYTPLVYNPAAPAAPEAIAPREKTPPPPDGATGTGLQAAALDQAPPAYPGFQPPQNYGYPSYSPFSGFGVPPSSTSSLGNLPALGPSPSSLSFGPSHASQPRLPFTSLPPSSVMDPNAHLLSTAPPVTQQPSYDFAPPATNGLQPPVGGYSNYYYSQLPQGVQRSMTSGGEYDIHRMAYRPTEGEHQVAYSEKAEEKKGNIQNKFNKFLKKLDSI